MKNLKTEVLTILSQLKGSGKFASIGTENFIIPGLTIEGVGDISFPLNENQAKKIIQVANKAPFGMGSSTIIDENIRKTWEIDSNKFNITNPAWEELLDKITEKIKADLGLEKYQIEANRYKLLLYEEGDFFLPHKDTEKEKDMFGSLIIGLPSKHKGGELIIEFGNEKEIANFENDFCVNYAAFYADCDHEIKPLISGYRICLAYNLIQKKKTQKINPPSLYLSAEKLAKILVEHEQKKELKPYIILLSHQYTPENFSKENLKLDDRSKVETLILAAEKAGFYSKMCLVTSYLEGTPEFEHYDYRYRSRNDDDDEDERDEDDDDDAEMGEVHEETLSIEHWVEDKFPKFNNIEFEEEDLITSFQLNEDEPIIKESTGYMGNYGPDLMHWYHYGAVMIWSPSTNAKLIQDENISVQLDWINYFSTINEINQEELEAVQSIIKLDLKGNGRSPDSEKYNHITKWIINQNQNSLLLNIDLEMIQYYFCKINIENWIELFEWLSPKERIHLFTRISSHITFETLEKLPCLFSKMIDSNLLNECVLEQSEKFPFLLLEIYQNEIKRVNASTINALFQLERKFQLNSEWVSLLIQALTFNSQREYVHKTLVPLLLSEKDSSQLKDNLIGFCEKYLENLVDNKPAAPINWTRELPDSAKNNSKWSILQSFLNSPLEDVYEYRKNKVERDQLESLIHNVVIDLKTETIKKGSPHTLRISKTQANYERLLKMWNEDVKLLTKIDKKSSKNI
jgi:hypothetical protein